MPAKQSSTSSSKSLPLTKLTLRRVIYALLIIGFLILLPMLFQKGLGSAYHFKSRYYIDQWQLGNEVTALQYANALLAREQAVNADRLNPHYLLTQAKVLEWGVFANTATPNKAKFNQLYKDAIALRPIWPNAYSDYAYNLAYFQQDLSGAWEQLEKAYIYGRYSPEVIRQALVIGFGFWQHLNVSQKQFVLEQALFAAQTNWSMKQELLAIAKANNLFIPICQYMKYQTQPIDKGSLQWINDRLCKGSNIKLIEVVQ